MDEVGDELAVQSQIQECVVDYDPGEQPQIGDNIAIEEAGEIVLNEATEVSTVL